MKILLTNDDGIQAKGIRTLAKVLSSEHEIYIVAPEGERSANSHAITYYRINHEAIREEVDGAKEAWAIVGATPADCTYYALHTILKDREPDLVISGINHGENFSSDCKYSGTVSAAMEGLIAGYPSIATSLCSYTSREFEVAAEVIRDLIPYYMQDELRHEYTLNVNIPSCAKEEIKGFKVTHFDSQRIYEKNIDLMHKEGNRY
ncbi:MAG: 5'/3'-nucleotidase SurE, partial [Solobacterium sp.]|nr:5'/3'-nucleotidase SurE [Solobacterium sp.]